MITLTVQELIDKLSKIPNKLLPVYFTPMSNNFIKYENIEDVKHDDFKCMLTFATNDEYFITDEEREDMKENHEIW